MTSSSSNDNNIDLMMIITNKTWRLSTKLPLPSLRIIGMKL